MQALSGSYFSLQMKQKSQFLLSILLVDVKSWWNGERNLCKCNGSKITMGKYSLQVSHEKIFGNFHTLFRSKSHEWGFLKIFEIALLNIPCFFEQRFFLQEYKGEDLRRFLKIGDETPKWEINSCPYKDMSVTINTSLKWCNYMG